RQPLVGEIGALVDVEVEIDRIHRNDIGQDGVVGVDQIALGNQAPRQPSGNRGANFGELQVELGAVQGCLRPVDVSVGRRYRLGSFVENLPGDISGLSQRFGAV